MAIAFNAFTDGASGVGTTRTFSVTVGSGANRLLVVGSLLAAGSFSGVTYNGVAMTLIDSQTPTFYVPQAFYYLRNPASGANNVVITASGSTTIYGVAADYTGVDQASAPDVTAKNPGPPPSADQQIDYTTVTNNCWGILFDAGNGAASTAISGCTFRGTDAVLAALNILDSGADLTPAGAKSMVTRKTGNSARGQIVAAFKPALSFIPRPPLIVDRQSIIRSNRW